MGKIRYPFNAIINATENATTDDQVLRQAFVQFMGLNDTDCIPWAKSADRTDLGATFTYMMCTWHPLSTWAVRDHGTSIFPALAPEDAEICPDDRFRSPLINNSDAWWTEQLQLEPERLAKTKRLLITTAQYDPGAAGVGPLSADGAVDSSDRNGARVIQTDRIAHIEDLVSYKIEPRGVNLDLDMVGPPASFQRAYSHAATAYNSYPSPIGMPG